MITCQIKIIIILKKILNSIKTCTNLQKMQIEKINNKKVHILDKSNKDINIMKEMNYMKKTINQLLISTKECKIIIVKIIQNIPKVPFK